jgi:OPT oligopeptide transporter protein
LLRGDNDDHSISDSETTLHGDGVDSDVELNSDIHVNAPTEDPFQPFPDLPRHGNANILTVRALLVGILCGALVNASNIYLGLKAGWTASANIFGVSPPAQV